MRVEATGRPITYKWPGGEIRLEPGKPIDLPDERAKRLLDRAPGKVRVVSSSIHPGSLISWIRADGTSQEGFVDHIHVDQDGKHWAFVSFGKVWSVVNLKFAKGPEEK